jgi:large subunit ribosomal protein L29
MKAKDLRERTAEDLLELEKTIGQDLFESRFKNFTNRLDDTSSLRKHRRELARIKTILTEKAKGAAPKATESKPAVEATAAKKAPAKKAAAPKKAAEPKAAKKAKATETK